MKYLRVYPDYDNMQVYNKQLKKHFTLVSNELLTETELKKYYNLDFQQSENKLGSILEISKHKTLKCFGVRFTYGLDRTQMYEYFTLDTSKQINQYKQIRTDFLKKAPEKELRDSELLTFISAELTKNLKSGLSLFSDGPFEFINYNNHRYILLKADSGLQWTLYLKKNSTASAETIQFFVAANEKYIKSYDVKTTAILDRTFNIIIYNYDSKKFIEIK